MNGVTKNQNLKFIEENGYVAVIAGGKGTRLFPLSHKERPKQFAQLDEENTFIQATVKRFLEIGFKEEHVVVITTTDRQTKLAKEQLCGDIGVLSQNIVQIGPDFDFAGAAHHATKFIHELDPSAIVLTTPSDQYIVANDEFQNSVVTAMQASADRNKFMLVCVKVTDLVTFTGCGHAVFNSDQADRKIKLVRKFVEKPDCDTADEMMRAGNSACNTGITTWRASSLMKVLGDKPQKLATDELMQKLSTVNAVVGKFRWHDCGTLSAFYDIAANKSRHKNVYRGGRIIREGCNESLMIIPEKSKLFIYGVNNVAVVQHYVSGKLVTIICKMDDSHQVKTLAERYEQNVNILLNDFSVSAKNNHFHTASMRDEAICGFVGVENISVSVEKDPDTDEITTSVYKQLETSL